MRIRSKFLMISAVPLVGVIVLIPLGGLAAVHAGADESELSWFLEFGLVLMTASLFSVLVGSEYVLKPLLKLAARAQTVLDPKDVKRDEVATLTRAFNTLQTGRVDATTGAADSARRSRLVIDLLVPAGEAPATSGSTQSSIEVVVRDALRHVEDGDRVDVGAMTRMDVVGDVRSELGHLVAEMFENAVRFSAPEARFIVAGRRDRGGYTVTISTPTPEGGVVANVWLPRDVLREPALGTGKESERDWTVQTEVADAPPVSATIDG